MLSPSGEQNYYGLEGEWLGHVTTPLQVKILFYNISPTSPSSHPSTLGAGVPRSKYMPLCILSLVVKIGWSYILVAHLLCRWVCLWTIYIYIYICLQWRGQIIILGLFGKRKCLGVLRNPMMTLPTLTIICLLHFPHWLRWLQWFYFY